MWKLSFLLFSGVLSGMSLSTAWGMQGGSPSKGSQTSVSSLKQISNNSRFQQVKQVLKKFHGLVMGSTQKQPSPEVVKNPPSTRPTSSTAMPQEIQIQTGGPTKVAQTQGSGFSREEDYKRLMKALYNPERQAEMHDRAVQEAHSTVQLAHEIKLDGVTGEAHKVLTEQKIKDLERALSRYEGIHDHAKSMEKDYEDKAFGKRIEDVEKSMTDIKHEITRLTQASTAMPPDDAATQKTQTGGPTEAVERKGPLASSQELLATHNQTVRDADDTVQLANKIKLGETTGRSYQVLAEQKIKYLESALSRYEDIRAYANKMYDMVVDPDFKEKPEEAATEMKKIVAQIEELRKGISENSRKTTQAAGN